MSGLSGFLFGNIDEEGRLDNDDFDEELKANLTLFTERIESKKILGLESLVEEQEAEEQRLNSEARKQSTPKQQLIAPLPDAEDFEEINELAEDQQKTISPSVSSDALAPSAPAIEAMPLEEVTIAPKDDVDMQVVPFDSRQILKFSRLSAPPSLLNATGRSYSRYSSLRKIRLKKRHLNNKQIDPVSNQIEVFLTKVGSVNGVPSSAAARLRLSLVNLSAVTGPAMTAVSGAAKQKRPWYLSSRFRAFEAAVEEFKQAFAEVSEPAIPSGTVHLPDDAHFHPLNLMDWESQVLWDDEVPFKDAKKPPGMYVNIAAVPPTTAAPTAPTSNQLGGVPSSQPVSNSPSLSSILSSLSLSGSGIGGDSAAATALLALIRNQQMQRSSSISSLGSSTSSLRATPPVITRSPSLANRQAQPPAPTLKFPKSSAARILNRALEEEDWTDSIIWDPAEIDPSKLSTHLILPLDDPELIFTAQSAEHLGKKLSRAEKLIAKRLKKLRTPGGNGEVLAIASYARPLPDKFNLSNDKYYEPANSSGANGTATSSVSNKTSDAAKIQASTVTSSSSISAAFLGLASSIPALQHAVPALKLSPPAFQTCRTKHELRLWHRPRLCFPAGFRIDGWARVKSANTSKKGASGTTTVSDSINGLAVGLNINQSGGVIRSFKKLSLRDSSRFLVLEYSEEYPPLMLNLGMGTYVVMYYRKKSPQDTFVPKSTFATVHVLDFTDPSPFWSFGDVPAGSIRYALTNGLFRAPLFPHPAPQNDFLCGRRVTVADEEGTQPGPDFFLRPLDIGQVFCVGQEFPVTEVPGPHSRKHNLFCRHRLQVAAYRLFNKDLTGLQTDPTRKRLKISRLLTAFPQFSEGSIRKWLKDFAESTRAGKDSGVWLLKLDAPQLDEDELRNLITPEMACAYESMMAEQQRISDAELLLFDPLAKDAGRNTVNLEDVDDVQSESESVSTAPAAAAAKKRTRPSQNISGPLSDVIRTSPWHLTANFISAVQGRTALQLRGLGDPSGHGEAFSFIKASASNMIMGKSASNLTPTSNEYRQEVGKIWEAQVAALSVSSPTRSEPVLPNSFTPALPKGSKLTIQRRVGDQILTETLEDPLLIAAYLRHRLQTAAAQADKKIRRGFVAPDALPVLSGTDLMPHQTNRNVRPGGDKKRSRPSQSSASASNKNLQIKCGACGQVGHMRTNRVCPLFGQTVPDVTEVNSESSTSTGPLKLKIKVAPVGSSSGSSNDSTLSSTDSIFPSPVILPVSHRPKGPPIQPLPAKPRKRPRKLTPKQRHAMFLAGLSAENRAKLVELSSHLVAAVDSIIALPTTLAFHKPVSRKLYPLYYKIIAQPLDLSSIRAKAVALTYLKSADLIDDFNLMARNCDQFNGQGSPLSLVAWDMVERVRSSLESESVRELDAFLVEHVKFTDEDATEGGAEVVSILTDNENSDVAEAEADGDNVESGDVEDEKVIQESITEDTEATQEVDTN